MARTDTSEIGLEALIVADMTGRRAAPIAGGVAEDPEPFVGLHQWILGDPKDYERGWTVDLAQLAAFLEATQPKIAEAVAIRTDGPTRSQFLARLQGEISKRGVIDVLRNGVRHGQHHVSLYFATPTPRNTQAEARYAANRFSVTRQLRYSREDTANALDLGLFINGLPIATFELKNSLTKQTVADAIVQYKRDRDPREKLFEFGRCIAHFAVDDAEVRFCTHLKGKESWFLPFNKGWNDGAGNPPGDGVKTDYLWKTILKPPSLSNIIEHYAQIVEKVDRKTGKKKREQVFPRYHQLDVVRQLLADTGAHGAGKRYLIQHSAGSGKSNSIAWLANQLVGLENDDKPVFGSIIVITDRTVLDQQIRDTIKQFAQVSSTIGAVTESSAQLREFIEGGKKVIISTVQKFPFILDELGSHHRQSSFAIIIDEAHSSQGGQASAAVNRALSESEEEDAESVEDQINAIMAARKLLPNASYFAFTATPKHKTLEIFGEPFQDGVQTKFRPFHSYTMKQAVEEGFIVDVLKHYTPVDSYYQLIKTTGDDPEFDTRRAKKKLRRYVEGHDHAIRLKAEIMVDHFHEQVLARGLIGGQARAMVVTGGIDRAVRYYQAIRDYLVERKSPHRAIVAFSGKYDLDGRDVTEAAMNAFPSSEIPDKFEGEPYRFLVCADKFQTGFDQPLLHTMYVDKPLSGIKAVQTLSRLNRAHPKKHDAFVLDFQNDIETIRAAFQDFFRTTILSEATDPNTLHDLKAALDGAQVYVPDQIRELVTRYLDGADRDRLDPILDVCVALYRGNLDEDAQVEFKGKAKAFIRTHGFLSSILPYTVAAWEELSIFLNFLVPKLPAPMEQDLSKGILDAIDMESYRIEKREARQLALADQGAEIDPLPTNGSARRPEPELDRLSNIIRAFNEQFNDIAWDDGDRVRQLIARDIPDRVAADAAYKNASQNSDRQNARIEHDAALQRVIVGLVKDDTQLFKQFSDNPDFKRWLADTIFGMTYQGPTP
jgi:type I restriction enzyme R subunit